MGARGDEERGGAAPMQLRPDMGLLRRTESVDPSFHPDLDRYLRDRALRAAILHSDRTQKADDPRGTKLTGTPYLTAEEGWPACEQCNRPLHHLF